MSFVCVVVVSAFLAGQPGSNQWFIERAARAEGLAKDGDTRGTLDLVREMEAAAAKLPPGETKDLWSTFVQWKKGVCAFWLGDYSLAIATLKDIESKDVNRPFRHYLCRDLGEAYLDSGRAKKAEPYFQQALDLGAAWEKKVSKRQYQDTEHLRIQLLQVRCKINNADFDDAKLRLGALEKKIFATLPKDAGDVAEQYAELQAEWQILHAETDLQDRNIVSALGRLENSQRNLERYPDNRKAVFLRFRCLLGLARDYWLLARFDNAGAHLERAEKVAATGKLYRTTLGRADIKNARAGLAIERAYLDVEEEVPAARIIASLDKAEVYLNDARKLHDSVHHGQDMFTAAVDFHRGQLFDLRGRALLVDGERKEMAQAQFEAGKARCDDALKQLQGVLQLADNHDRVLEVRNRRAWLNLRLGAASAARDEAGAALKLFEAKEGENDIDRGRYLHSLMAAENALGNTAAASQYAAQHRKLIDKGLGQLLAGLSASEQVQFFRRWDAPGLHASLNLGIQHAKTNSKLAADSVEWLINGKAKLAEVLAAQTQTTRAASKQAFASYQQSVTRQAYILYGQASNDEKLVNERYLAEDAHKRDLASAAAKGLIAEPRWYTLAEVQKNLRGDEVYVGIYALRPKESEPRSYYAWIVANTAAVQIVDLGKASVIDNLVVVFTREIEKMPAIAPGEERRAEDRLKRLCLTELSLRVLQPIQKAAAGKTRWIVSPDGPLWNVPWSALLLPDQRYAIEEMTFRYAVSGQDLVGSKESLAKGNPLVLGDPWFNYPESDRQRLRKPGLDPLWLPWDRLEYSRRECETVLAIMEANLLKPSRMLGMVQKRQLAELAAAPRLVYLSTHAFATLKGSVDVEDPLLSCALAFAGWNYLPKANENELPGLMTGAEVLGIDLRGTELVVLGSCAAANEELTFGQSPANLRHAFHLAGARAVVSALWGINDKATLELMEPFVEAICRPNADKIAALRDAQQQSIRYLRLYRDHAHPYYWAGFTISGS